MILCPKCQKPLELKSESAFFKTYLCGHIFTKNYVFPNGNQNKALEEIVCPPDSINDLFTNLDRWVSDGGLTKPKSDEEIKADEDYMSFFNVDCSKRAYEYQQVGVLFAEKGKFRILFADAMGVGKTIEALVTLKRNPQTTLILVKQSTIIQWMREYHDWVSMHPFDVFPIFDRTLIVPGAKVYIMSMDLLSRKGIIDKLNACGITQLIVDECQNFKNMNSKRTEALFNFVGINQIERILLLSGTPIKNRADEYYPSLHLLDPIQWYSLDYFRANWCERTTDENGRNPKWNRILPEREEEFKRITSKYIIRREKTDVLKNLPPLTRDWQFIEITDQLIKDSYNETLTVFENWMENKAEVNAAGILGWLAKLRAITGVAKVPNCIEWIKDFLESSDEPIAIGIHHDLVRDSLYYALNAAGIKTLKLSGEDSAIKKDNILERFRRGEARVLVINSLSGGVGLNIQCCPNFIQLEREWNHADEEQFEARFWRDGQKIAVTGTYLMIAGTIDELLHNYVFDKSHNTASAGIGEGRNITMSLSHLKSFAEEVIKNRL